MKQSAGKDMYLSWLAANAGWFLQNDTHIPQTAAMITFQQLVIYTESNRDSFALLTLHGRLQHSELSQAPIVLWLLQYATHHEKSMAII